ncbi:baseplate J/gp47 family protein [Methylocystis sp. S23]
MARLDDPGPYNLDMLRALPAPELFERDPKVLEQSLIAWFEAATGRTLYPMQIETLLIGTVAYLWSLMAEEARIAHMQRYAALADEPWLAQLGAQPGIETPRLDAVAATAMARFSRTQLGAAVVIPTGTRVSAGSDTTVFLTVAEATIGAGVYSVDVLVRCATPGSAANGLTTGKISAIVDAVAGVETVANVTTSAGGVDRESVDAYRLRLCNALEKASTRGQRRGYVEHVMAYTGAIIAVAAVRPQPCYVDIYPLTATGPAGPALRAQIEEHLYDLQENELLPMGDLVTVKPPEPYLPEFRLVVYATADRIGTRVAAEAAARDVLRGWGSRLGGEVLPQVVREAAKSASGASNVESVSLKYRRLQPWEFVDGENAEIQVDVRLPEDEQ